jgi:uncharacterized protein (TIGR02594 family)
MTITLYDLAQRFVGIKEIGERGKDHPLIQFGFSLCGMSTETPDEVPWCSAWLQIPPWLLRLPRSKSAAARSWLLVGIPQHTRDAQLGDVVVLSRGSNPAQGHVGLFAGWGPNGEVLLLGGNQSNSVSIEGFDATRILGVRRLT